MEKVHVLWNIGALYNQLALNSSQSGRNSVEAIKKAALFFQQSAGVFQILLDDYLDELQRLGSHEFSVPVLKILMASNLALAQECFFVKAVLDKAQDGRKKDATLSKVAAKAGDLFRSVHELARGDQHFSHKEWLIPMQVRHLMLESQAQIRKAKDCGAQSLFGEEIARLGLAETLLKRVNEFGKNLPDVVAQEVKASLSDLLVQIKRAEKENDVIYLQSIPSAADLSQLDMALLVKPVPLPAMSALMGNRILFASLMPPALASQLASYKERKGAVVQKFIEAASRASSDLAAALNEMGLPGSLQALEQPVGLPDEILQKSEEVRSLGGAQMLTENIQTLKVLSDEDRDLLKEIEKLLDDELAEDNNCRSQFKDRWSRQSSEALQKHMREQLDKNKKYFADAQASDKIVISKFESNLPFIESLSASKSDLEASIPRSSVGSSAAILKEPVIVRLKELVKSADSMIQERNLLIQSIKKRSETDDIFTLLAEALTKDQSQMDAVCTQQLTKYVEFQSKFDASLARQSELLAETMHSNDLFRGNVKNLESVKQRETALQNLTQAYSAFMSLKGNFEEGMKFYNDFSGLLVKLRDQVKDYAFARSSEKKDHIKDITTTLANMNVYGSANPAGTPHQPGPTSTYPSMSAVQPGVWNPSEPISYGGVPNPSYPGVPQPSYGGGQNPVPQVPGGWSSTPGQSMYGQVPATNWPGQAVPPSYGQVPPGAPVVYGQSPAPPYGQAPHSYPVFNHHYRPQYQ